MERRLAAILAADVVGYTRLMGDDEAGTLTRLKAHRKDFVGPKIAEHKGRIVKLMGDGLLAEFASVVDAVACAAALQAGMAERNADVPEPRRIVLRIGINLGDVIIEGDDIYGDGVNIAARLEGLAEPGGICVSAKVHDEVANKLALGFEDLGARELKNVGDGRVVRRRGGGRRGGASDPREALHRRAALHQHVGRPGAGVLRRRHQRGPDHRAVEDPLVLRHRPQQHLHLQGPGGRGDPGRPRAGRALRP
jgi:class 3 adenylate cyclase